MSRHLVRRARAHWTMTVTWRWWSLRNWVKGYRFDPVRRFRCCDHTTPSHYRTCGEAGRG